jgi:hypothetical protein
MNKCVIENCNKEKHHSKLYCSMHYKRLKYTGTTDKGIKARGTLEERFWKKVDKKSDNECWLWTGAKNQKGYGYIGAGSKNGKMLTAHRLSYQLANNDLHDYDYVLHSCDNPSCVNPLHLRAGTQSENIKEACDKGRKTPPIFFGKDNPKSKLTIEKVKFIRANPQLGHKEIANMFGLSPNCIRGVRIGRTWKDIK